MTKLDIVLEWFLFTLAFCTAFFSMLQAGGLLSLTDRDAIYILTVVTNVSAFLPIWVRKGQDLYDKIKESRK